MYFVCHIVPLRWLNWSINWCQSDYQTCFLLHLGRPSKHRWRIKNLFPGWKVVLSFINVLIACLKREINRHLWPYLISTTFQSIEVQWPQDSNNAGHIIHVKWIYSCPCGLCNSSLDRFNWLHDLGHQLWLSSLFHEMLRNKRFVFTMEPQCTQDRPMTACHSYQHLRNEGPQTQNKQSVLV